MRLPLKAGFIGVGNMGAAMAGNLLRAGCSVVVCDRNAEAVSQLLKQGATFAATPAELGATPGMDAVVSMLPTSGAVRDAYLGASGLLTGGGGTLHPRLLIDSSTIDPATSREVAMAAEQTMLHPDAAKAHGQRYADMIDAPVSGGVPGAQAASLTFMCGGGAAAIEAARPLLMKMGKRLVRCGDHGSGSGAKLANNLVLAVQMAAVSEGLAFGKRLGLDPVLLSAIFDTSSAQCWATSHYSPCPGVMEGVPSSRGYSGGFSSALMVKDLTLAMEAAERCGSQLPMTEQALALYRQVVEKADPALDFSAIYEYVYGKTATLKE